MIFSSMKLLEKNEKNTLKIDLNESNKDEFMWYIMHLCFCGWQSSYAKQ